VNGCLTPEKGVDLEKALTTALPQLDGWREAKTKDVIREVEADIVVELTPGNIQTGEPGLSHILTALSSGKHVVTSNKAPLAVAYRRIMDEAAKNGRAVRFEATVGGAIPIMNLMEYCLPANEVTHAYGILNGTTNYILSKMAEEGVPLESALKEAQELGYAEPDPKYDLDGVDSAVKVVILANALLGKDVSYRDMKVTGIRDITSEAVELARKSGYVIKLVGDVKRLEVSPRLVPVNHPLNVSGSLNALMLNTDVAGDLTLIGRGAGAKETSSSILSDILSVSGKRYNEA
jgi:homoserine dehydrogenase